MTHPSPISGLAERLREHAALLKRHAFKTKCWPGDNDFEDSAGYMLQAADALASPLPVAAQGVVTVKGLEWEPEGDDDDMADGAAGRYWVRLARYPEQRAAGLYQVVFIHQSGDSLTQSILGEGLDRDAAKSQAEDHHRRCALDWIEPTALEASITKTAAPLGVEPEFGTAVSEETREALKAIDDGQRAAAAYIIANPPLFGHGNAALATPVTGEADVERLTRERDALQEYAREATKAITGLTAGGSEYFGKRIGDIYTADLPFCVQRIRERFEREAEWTRKILSEKKAAESRIEALTAEVGRLSEIERLLSCMDTDGCLDIGHQVTKRTGYPFPGEVRSVFKTRAGLVRYVIEATGADYAGMLHIFSPEQLTASPQGSSAP